MVRAMIRSLEQPSRTRHVPQRTCIACRQTKAKRELIRVVSTVTGRVVVDPAGKSPGRGAYLCGNQKCWEAGLKRARLDRALHTTIEPDDRTQLLAFSQTLPLSSEAPV